MQSFSKNMMNIFFGHFVVYFASDFQIRTNIAFPEAMISLEQYLFGETMLNDITLNDF
jgi:hypothetical protein